MPSWRLKNLLLTLKQTCLLHNPSFAFIKITNPQSRWNVTLCNKFALNVTTTCQKYNNRVIISRQCQNISFLKHRIPPLRFLFQHFLVGDYLAELGIIPPNLLHYKLLINIYVTQWNRNLISDYLTPKFC